MTPSLLVLVLVAGVGPSSESAPEAVPEETSIPVQARPFDPRELLDPPAPLVPMLTAGDRAFSSSETAPPTAVLSWDFRWWQRISPREQRVEHPDVVARPSVVLRSGFAEASAVSVQQDMLWSARSTTSGHLDGVSRQATSSMLLLRFSTP